ncbi:MAG TPA: hypothetical protein VES20_06430, partial [Bryobacteraceae bacterium]|nr:hypothetical protein [Bryobacteraceae bacterium]
MSRNKAVALLTVAGNWSGGAIVVNRDAQQFLGFAVQVDDGAVQAFVAIDRLAFGAHHEAWKSAQAPYPAARTVMRHHRAHGAPLMSKPVDVCASGFVMIRRSPSLRTLPSSTAATLRRSASQ